MKPQPQRHWPTVAISGLVIALAFFVGAFLATRFVSPCVCVHVQQTAVQ